MEAPLHSRTMDPNRLLLSPRKSEDDVIEDKLLVILPTVPHLRLCFAPLTGITAMYMQASMGEAMHAVAGLLQEIAVLEQRWGGLATSPHHLSSTSLADTGRPIWIRPQK